MSVERRNRLFVGLTGGFAAGKTTVSNILHKKFGIVVIDVDQAGRAATETKPVLLALQDAFGADYFNAQGLLRRKKLGRLVFRDEQARKTLNDIVHPAMLAMVATAMHSVDQATLITPYVIVDAALLFELDLHRQMDLVVTVTAPSQVCVQRAVRRDGMSRQQATARLQAQLPAEDKESRADFVIHNGKDLTALKKSVYLVHDKLLAAAERKKGRAKKYESDPQSTGT